MAVLLLLYTVMPEVVAVAQLDLLPPNLPDLVMCLQVLGIRAKDMDEFDLILLKIILVVDLTAPSLKVHNSSLFQHLASCRN